MPDDNLDPIQDLHAATPAYVLDKTDQIRGDLCENQRALGFIMGQIAKLQRDLVRVALVATIAGAGLVALAVDLLTRGL